MPLSRKRPRLSLVVGTLVAPGASPEPRLIRRRRWPSRRFQWHGSTVKPLVRDEDSFAATAAEKSAEVLNRLDHTPPEIARDQVAELLTDGLRKELDRQVRPRRRKRLEKNLDSHLLCSLFAAFACLADDIQDQIPAATAAIIESQQGERSSVDGFVIRVAVDAAWIEFTKLAQHVAFTAAFGHTIMAARFLGAVICPNANQHPDVQRCCVNSIVVQMVAGPLKDMIEHLLP